MKSIIQIVLWVVIGILGYLIYNSIEAPIQFEKVKKERYLPVVKTLEDVRQSQIAHKEVTGEYADNFDNLISFLDTAEYVITQQRDTSYLDEEYKENFGVDKYISDYVVDTLGYTSVKDSLFKNSDRYKDMRYVPGLDKQEFEMSADSIPQGDKMRPVFEAYVNKEDLLKDQDENLVEREKERQSVDDINGSQIRIGSLSKLSDNGNWPKDYGKDSKD